MEGGEELSESGILDILESMFDALPELRSQMELHREQDSSSRTSDGLHSRMKTLVDRDVEARQRSQQEDAFSKQLGGSQQLQRGTPGQEQRQTPSK